MPREAAAVSAQVLCTPYNQAPCYFMQSHIRKVYACLVVTCHLHFWQNDRDLLRAPAVTRGCNGYRNKSQHRKSTLEKKILPPLLQGFEPATFQSLVRRSNYWVMSLVCRFLCAGGNGFWEINVVLNVHITEIIRLIKYGGFGEGKLDLLYYSCCYLTSMWRCFLNNLHT